MALVHFVFMRGGMCLRDEAVLCALVVCAGPRDGMIGCILHVNVRGCLGVYIWRRSARQEMKWTLINTHTYAGKRC